MTCRLPVVRARCRRLYAEPCDVTNDVRMKPGEVCSHDTDGQTFPLAHVKAHAKVWELRFFGMAQLFEDERNKPDNAIRENFVFMGYPWDPSLPKADYDRVVAELGLPRDKPVNHAHPMRVAGAMSTRRQRGKKETRKYPARESVEATARRNWVRREGRQCARPAIDVLKRVPSAFSRGRP